MPDRDPEDLASENDRWFADFDALPTCSDCGGEGVVPWGLRFVDCLACGGTGKVFPEDNEAALFVEQRHDADPQERPLSFTDECTSDFDIGGES